MARPPVPVRLASLREEVAARAADVGEAGPLRREELDEFARRAHDLVVEHLVGGWPGVDAAFRFAAALDASAELAWWFEQHAQPAAAS